MSDETVLTEDMIDLQQIDELTVLKQRARLMNIVFSNNIGIQALRQKIDAKMSENEQSLEADADITNALTGESPKPAKRNVRQEMMDEQLKLVRLRITCLDPKKKDLPGEIFTVANEFLGTVRKFVPFGEVTDDGYHVPFIIYTMMKSRKFLNIRLRKGANGQTHVESNWVQEFALEVLPQLTKEEIAKLAAAQTAAGLFASDGPTF